MIDFIRKKISILRKVKNPFRFYLIRAVEDKFIKGMITNFYKNKIGIKTHNYTKSNLVKESDISNHTSNLQNDGYSILENKLQEKTLEKIISFSKTINCYDPYRKNLGAINLSSVPEDTHIAHFGKEDLIKSREIMDIANDGGLLKIVENFLGATPTISNINMWWSFSNKEEAEEAQLFHRDVDDFKFCKFFIYLTDVTETTGPHIYVKKTAQSTKLRKVRRYSDDEIEIAFGKENILTFTAEKGTSFIVDTYGFHKGKLPNDGNRLLLQIQYSLLPLEEEKYNPSEIKDYDVYDSYINRLMIKM